MTEGRARGPLPLLIPMKKEILIVLSVVLVVVIVACGLWLGYYAVDSQHQKQTYETLAEDFLLEEPKSSLSLAEDDSPELNRPLPGNRWSP